MKAVIIHSAARAELERSIEFYESRTAGLGLDFQEKVEQGAAKIQQNPRALAST